LTNQEFELIDALYFTIPFDRLKVELDWEEHVLKEELLKLIQKGWVKCMEGNGDEEVENLQKIDSNYRNLSFLATKQGLLEHNSR
jgi:hypothetical protein